VQRDRRQGRPAGRGQQLVPRDGHPSTQFSRHLSERFPLEVSNHGWPKKSVSQAGLLWPALERDAKNPLDSAL